jgi:hypothetical protein
VKAIADLFEQLCVAAGLAVLGGLVVAAALELAP